MGKRFAAIGMAAAIAGGGLAVAAVNPLQAVGASTGSAATSTTEVPSAGQPGTGRGIGQGNGPLATALKALVADGTLTQDQADKVVAKVKAEAEAARAERKDRRTDRRQELLDAAATAIGSTPEQMKAGLKDGKSLAAQAEAKGVSRQTLVDALTKAIDGQIDQAVADGKLPADRAAKLKARTPKVVERIVDADGHRLRQAGRGGLGAGGFRGRRGN